MRQNWISGVIGSAQKQERVRGKTFPYGIGVRGLPERKELRKNFRSSLEVVAYSSSKAPVYS